MTSEPTATAMNLPGATGIQMNSAPASPNPATQPAALASSSVVGNVTRVTTQDGAVSIQQGQHVSHNSGNSTSQGNTTAPAAIKSPLGSVRSGADVKPTDVVTLRSGFETSVAAALATGMLTKDAQGNYLESFIGEGGVSTPTPAASEATDSEKQTQERATSEPVATLDESSEVILDTFIGSVGSGDLQGGLKAMLDGGSLPDDVVARAGSRLGLESEQVRAQVETVRSAFERQAVDAVGARVLDWAKQNRLPELKDAAREQVNAGTLKGYTALSRQYVEQLAKIDPDAILRSPDAQARGVRRESNGTITVEIPDVGRIEWRAAIKAGFIGPKFGKPASQPTAAPTKSYPTAHPSDIATLRGNPSHGNRVNFDSHYGIGAAVRYLGT
jgi:hypothetical protein